ncbi:hypothetical protein HHI36_001283 [Cryptolaemus montrouzieri]|uniref:Uncharacterized protein n=1 Tax=Cryptolaemus montrouzieri TaxID=559131 RepID=A0ABD2P6Y2_9CUCU
MALQRILLPRVCTTYFRPMVSLQKYVKGTPSSGKPQQTIEVEDAFDNFTTELLQKKMNSWDIKKKKVKLLRCSSPEKFDNIDMSIMNKSQLNEIFTKALDECNDSGTIKLTKNCIKYEICPSEDILLRAMFVCAQNGEVNLIQNLKQLCETVKINFSANFDFCLYEAHAIWMKGNIIKALEVFEKLYMINPFLRRNIKLLLKKLICDGAKKNSEVVLLHIIKFSENIILKYKDFFPMICVWEVCFMSEWFSDQQMALELLRRNRRLCEVLGPRLPYILALCLKSHQTEAIYRLLEILLSFK